MAAHWLLRVLLLVFAISLQGAARTTVTLTTRTTVAQGRTSTYTSTITATQNPAATPMLVYNCAKMPAICNNIDKINPLDPGTKILIGPQYLEFHYDTNSDRSTKRRADVCGNFHQQGIHDCPEIDQPAVAVSGGWSDIDGRPNSPSFVGQTFLNNRLGMISGAEKNIIADEDNDYQGMYWSCDEWPPAS